jgi:WhiB family redox-sensing transcriptional regulator
MMASSGNEELPTIEDFLNRPVWMASAACRGMDVNLFFPTRGETAKAKRARAICATCPVRAECYHYAGSFSDVPAGVWGGESERSRQGFGVVA